jgi:hypothetical protein
LPGTFPAIVEFSVNDSAVPSQQAAKAHLKTFDRGMLPLDVIAAAEASISALLSAIFLCGRK